MRARSSRAPHRIAASRGAEPAREPDDGLGLGEAIPGEVRGGRGQRRRVRPLAALERVARRDGGEGERACEVIHVHLPGRGDLLHEGPRLAVTAELEIAVHHVVVGVQALVRAETGLRPARGQRFRGGLGGRAIGVDGLLPAPHAREDVRRHVQRVGRRRGDAGVALRGGQALGRDRREVVAVDQVVGHPRMIGLLGEGLLEDAGGLELVGVGLVVGVERDVERERVEDGGLAVGRDSARRSAPWRARRPARGCGGPPGRRPCRRSRSRRCTHARDRSGLPPPSPARPRPSPPSGRARPEGPRAGCPATPWPRPSGPSRRRGRRSPPP